MIAYLRDYYAADGMRGVRALAARAVRDAMADHRTDARRIPEDREAPTGEPLAFAIDGRQMWDDAFGPAVAYEPQPWRPSRWNVPYRSQRAEAQHRAERRWHALDRIAQRHHV